MDKTMFLLMWSNLFYKKRPFPTDKHRANLRGISTETRNHPPAGGLKSNKERTDFNVIEKLCAK